MATGGSCEAFKSQHSALEDLGEWFQINRRRNGDLNLSIWSMTWWVKLINWLIRFRTLVFGILESLGFGKWGFLQKTFQMVSFHPQIPFLFFAFFRVLLGSIIVTSQDPPVCVWFISYFSTGLACCLEDFVSGPRLCVETSDNVEEALDALLEEAKLHVVDFLSDRQVPEFKPAPKHEW